MVEKRYLLTIATFVLLYPYVAHAQAEPGTVHRRTYTYPETSQRGPTTGFSIGMNPGLGNSYNYSYILSVTPGSAADAAGLMVGDTILAVDGRDVREGALFPVKVAGTRYVILVRRGDEEVELVFTYPQIEEVPRREGTNAAPPE